eukprot:CAMPEP_0170537178 /NCGR_PEP_ID=MMETSP0209-20121228/102559_1 /TAXON_ID=665100 ORGANISM="Litonotus pictus, Strain P1" /NCGR_SAMPLE_ID=MMETSP0209 /ASSEMBLY_ACC=CAM_ASM_000301 /LENGTH=1673 /DNA_ID=CAMNT_0010838635 /DNA_START=4688 /DNA_END=9709 /DNA_ORIENTATION=-
MTLQNKKINKKYSFDKTVNLKKYCIETEERLAFVNEQDENEKIYKKRDEYYDYVLVGVVIHSGSAEGGHYYSYIDVKEDAKKQNKGILNNGNSKENENLWGSNKGDFKAGSCWLEFNDSSVSFFDAENLKREAFGGNENENNANGQTANPAYQGAGVSYPTDVDTVINVEDSSISNYINNLSQQGQGTEGAAQAADTNTYAQNHTSAAANPGYGDKFGQPMSDAEIQKLTQTGQFDNVSPYDQVIQQSILSNQSHFGRSAYMLIYERRIKSPIRILESTEISTISHPNNLEDHKLVLEKNISSKSNNSTKDLENLKPGNRKSSKYSVGTGKNNEKEKKVLIVNETNINHYKQVYDPLSQANSLKNNGSISPLLSKIFYENKKEVISVVDYFEYYGADLTQSIRENKESNEITDTKEKTETANSVIIHKDIYQEILTDNAVSKTIVTENKTSNESKQGMKVLLDSLIKKLMNINKSSPDSLSKNPAYKKAFETVFSLIMEFESSDDKGNILESLTGLIVNDEDFSFMLLNYVTDSNSNSSENSCLVKAFSSNKLKSLTSQIISKHFYKEKRRIEVKEKENIVLNLGETYLLLGNKIKAFIESLVSFITQPEKAIQLSFAALKNFFSLLREVVDILGENNAEGNNSKDDKSDLFCFCNKLFREKEVISCMADLLTKSYLKSFTIKNKSLTEENLVSIRKIGMSVLMSVINAMYCSHSKKIEDKRGREFTELKSVFASLELLEGCKKELNGKGGDSSSDVGQIELHRLYTDKRLDKNNLSSTILSFNDVTCLLKPELRFILIRTIEEYFLDSSYSMNSKIKELNRVSELLCVLCYNNLNYSINLLKTIILVLNRGQYNQYSSTASLLPFKVNIYSTSKIDQTEYFSLLFYLTVKLIHLDDDYKVERMNGIFGIPLFNLSDNSMQSTINRSCIAYPANPSHRSGDKMFEFVNPLFSASIQEDKGISYFNRFKDFLGGTKSNKPKKPEVNVESLIERVLLSKSDVSCEILDYLFYPLITSDIVKKVIIDDKGQIVNENSGVNNNVSQNFRFFPNNTIPDFSDLIDKCKQKEVSNLEELSLILDERLISVALKFLFSVSPKARSVDIAVPKTTTSENPVEPSHKPSLFSDKFSNKNYFNNLISPIIGNSSQNSEYVYCYVKDTLFDYLGADKDNKGNLLNIWKNITGSNSNIDKNKMKIESYSSLIDWLSTLIKDTEYDGLRGLNYIPVKVMNEIYHYIPTDESSGTNNNVSKSNVRKKVVFHYVPEQAKQNIQDKDMPPSSSDLELLVVEYQSINKTQEEVINYYNLVREVEISGQSDLLIRDKKNKLVSCFDNYKTELNLQEYKRSLNDYEPESSLVDKLLKHFHQSKEIKEKKSNLENPIFAETNNFNNTEYNIGVSTGKLLLTNKSQKIRFFSVKINYCGLYGVPYIKSEDSLNQGYSSANYEFEIVPCEKKALYTFLLNDTHSKRDDIKYSDDSNYFIEVFLKEESSIEASTVMKAQEKDKDVKNEESKQIDDTKPDPISSNLKFGKPESNTLDKLLGETEEIKEEELDNLSVKACTGEPGEFKDLNSMIKTDIKYEEITNLDNHTAYVNLLDDTEAGMPESATAVATYPMGSTAPDAAFNPNMDAGFYDFTTGSGGGMEDQFDVDCVHCMTKNFFGSSTQVFLCKKCSMDVFL